jgi:carbonic anhydrase
MASGSDISADAALLRLKEGNDRFVSGRPHSRKVHAELLADLAGGQSPCTTVLGCSDSRVAPEIVFDAPFGDLFVIRVAGNILDPAIAGTLQYAGQHLHTPLFVVLGHEGCGAVHAALEERFHGVRQRSRIATLLEYVAPALDGLDPSLPPAVLLSAAVEANVRHSMRQLLETPEGKARVQEGVVKLVGAIYDIATGRVRFLD